MSKTYTHYREITPKEALQALADNDGKSVDGFAFRDDCENDWVLGELLGYVSDYPYRFMSISKWRFCAEVEEIDPRQVPEGCPPLPEPWLAYVPRDMVNSKGKYWITCDYGRWSENYNGFANSSFNHFAIDVRTDFAKTHFPQIVEAMEYEESDQLADPLEQWWNGIKNRPFSYIPEILREAYKLGQKNPIK